MAFERSLDATVKAQKKALEDLHSQFDMAALKMFRSAAGRASGFYSSLSSDPSLLKAMKNIRKHAGLTGKAAADEWMNGWSSTMPQLNKLSQKMAGTMLDFNNRMTALSERKTAGWSKAAKYAKLEADITEKATKQIGLNETAIKKLRYERDKVRADKTLSPMDAAHQKKHLEDRVTVLKNMTKQLKIARDGATGFAKQMQELAVQEKIQKLKDKAYGGFNSKLNSGVEGWQTMKHVVKNPALLFSAIAAGLVLAVVAIFKALLSETVKVVKVFNDAGQIPAQWGRSLLKTSEVMRSMTKERLFIDSKEAAEAVAASQKEMGMLDIPQEIANQTAYMNKMFGLSQQESAKYVTMLYRLNGRNQQEAVKISNSVSAWAVKNGLNARDIAADIASHGEDLAKSMGMSAIKMAEAAADARRMGYDLSSLTGLADRLVSDFEGALRTQAELSTFFPGMDMTQVTYASQFGDMADMKNAVHDMLDSSGITDFGNLARSHKLMLSRNTGLSSTALAGMLGGDAESYRSVSDNARIDEQQGVYKTAFELAEGGFGTVIKILKQILWSFGPMRAVGWGLHKIFGGKNGGVKEFHSGGIVGGLSSIASQGIKGNEVPAILEKGEAVLTRRMLQNATSLIASVHSINNALEGTAQANTVNTTQTQHAPTNNAKIEQLLVQLVRATESGKVIQIDGREVGRTVVSASSRYSG